MRDQMLEYYDCWVVFYDYLDHALDDLLNCIIRLISSIE